MKITRTITIDGKSKAEYQAIVEKMEAEQSKIQGWSLVKEPIVNRVTAIKTEEVDSL